MLLYYLAIPDLNIRHLQDPDAPQTLNERITLRHQLTILILPYSPTMIPVLSNVKDQERNYPSLITAK